MRTIKTILYEDFFSIKTINVVLFEVTIARYIAYLEIAKQFPVQLSYLISPLLPLVMFEGCLKFS